MYGVASQTMVHNIEQREFTIFNTDEFMYDKYSGIISLDYEATQEKFLITNLMFKENYFFKPIYYFFAKLIFYVC